jgi:carboxymethylenebutenolidase
VIQLETADGPMPVYEVRPDGARAAVIVIQEAFGVNAHIRDVAARLGAEGFHAVAPALFHRTGAPELGYGDFGEVMPHMGALDDEKILTDVDAVLAHLWKAGWQDPSVGIVGFCMGGRVSFLVAARRSLGAAVGFYGGGIVTSRFPIFPALVEEAPTLHTPWLGIFGDADASIPVDDVERLRRELEPALVDTEIVRYADAGHGFFCDLRDAYDADAAADAWPRTLTWFRDHLHLV